MICPFLTSSNILICRTRQRASSSRLTPPRSQESPSKAPVESAQDTAQRWLPPRQSKTRFWAESQLLRPWGIWAKRTRASGRTATRSTLWRAMGSSSNRTGGLNPCKVGGRDDGGGKRNKKNGKFWCEVFVLNCDLPAVVSSGVSEVRSAQESWKCF